MVGLWTSHFLYSFVTFTCMYYILDMVTFYAQDVYFFCISIYTWLLLYNCDIQVMYSCYIMLCSFLIVDEHAIFCMRFVYEKIILL